MYCIIARFVSGCDPAARRYSVIPLLRHYILYHQHSVSYHYKSRFQLIFCGATILYYTSYYVLYHCDGRLQLIFSARGLAPPPLITPIITAPHRHTVSRAHAHTRARTHARAHTQTHARKHASTHARRSPRPCRSTTRRAPCKVQQDPHKSMHIAIRTNPCTFTRRKARGGAALYKVKCNTIRTNPCTLRAGMPRAMQSDANRRALRARCGVLTQSNAGMHARRVIQEYCASRHAT